MTVKLAFPSNVKLVTTLETNWDEGYEQVAKAPLPSERYQQFLGLDYPQKVITTEPILNFDLEEFTSWVVDIGPAYMWVGFNSRARQVQLPEPSVEKLLGFTAALKQDGVQIKAKI